jgi:hypothetical protein
MVKNASLALFGDSQESRPDRNSKKKRDVQYISSLENAEVNGHGNAEGPTPNSATV